MERRRESNYDLLRIVASFAVVLVHIVNVYYQALSDASEFGFRYANGAFFIILAEAITHFAVPCFFMLSGAFILGNRRNGDFRFFYRKSFDKIGIDAVVFGCVGFFIGLAMAVIKYAIIGNQPFSVLAEPFIGVIKGEPFYHLWYLTVLLGLYILAPFVIMLASEMAVGGGKSIREDYICICDLCKPQLACEYI